MGFYLDHLTRNERCAQNLSESVMIGLPLVVLLYFASSFCWVKFSSRYFEMDGWKLANHRECRWREMLGLPLVLGDAQCSGTFVAGLLAASRIPFVLAADGYMPQGFTQLNKKYATPSRAIITSAAIYLG